ncbi:hydrolase, putative [Minicystis rosea]|nr:hydrolase, putative [Minicystis rosea]
MRALITTAALFAGAATVPRATLGRGADALLDGDVEAQRPLATAVVADVGQQVSASSFHTGDARFDGEWALVTNMMAALGLGQIVLAHPETRSAYLPAIEVAVDRLLAAEATAFGKAAWGTSWAADLGSDHGHAYLGYVNLAVGMLRLLEPTTRAAADHERITAALVRRMQAAPHALIETYPGEAYPADVASVIGSIGMYDRATGARHEALLQRLVKTFRARWIDPQSGLALQAGDTSTGRPTAPPRASGSAIAAYFLSFADPALAHDLARALVHQRASFFGMGGVREYPPGVSGHGDIDSGPVLFGVSVSATGFALAGARMIGDRAMYTEILRTAELFGMPHTRGPSRRFATGGPLGNAILLAMLTAEVRR